MWRNTSAMPRFEPETPANHTSSVVPNKRLAQLLLARNLFHCSWENAPPQYSILIEKNVPLTSNEQCLLLLGGDCQGDAVILPFACVARRSQASHHRVTGFVPWQLAQALCSERFTGFHAENIFNAEICWLWEKMTLLVKVRFCFYKVTVDGDYMPEWRITNII